jgi:hypothetical protein
LIQKGSASLLFPQGLTGTLAQHLSLCAVDSDYLEVLFTGTWLTTEQEAEEGVFLTILSPALEAEVIALWQTARAVASATLS